MLHWVNIISYKTRAFNKFTMTNTVRISSRLSFPSLSEYARSVAVYLLNMVLEYDGELIVSIEQATDFPTNRIMTSVENAYDNNVLSLFDFEDISQMAKYDPTDFYANKILQNGLEYANVSHWFKRAVMQSTYQPLAYMQLRLADS